MNVNLYQGLISFNWNLLFTAITVLVLFLILKHFFFEKVHNIIVARQNQIEDDLTSAKKAHDEADERLKSYENTLSEAEDEKRRIIKEARDEAKVKAEEIVTEAKEEAMNIVSEAQKKAKLEEEKAVIGLKKEIASIAIMAAGQIIEKDLNEEDHLEIVGKVLEEAEKGKWQNQ